MKKYKVLIVHNKYQHIGGEYTVVESERLLLQSRGHEVLTYFRDNSELNNINILQKIYLLFNLLFNIKTYKDISRLIEVHKPDVCHVHNIIPLVSPSVYIVCKRKNIPVVQTIHNYRYGCVNGNLFLNNRVCEKCINSKIPYSIYYKCYRNSFLQTIFILLIMINRSHGIRWGKNINRYIVLSEFAKKKNIEIGIPVDKIVIKPNFILDNEREQVTKDNEFLYVGRLEEKKGILDLLEVLKKMPNIKLNIIGGGPLLSKVVNCGNQNVKYLGQVDHNSVLNELSKCKALIFPSKWYEGMPMVIIEAFSFSVPVISSKIGTMGEIIQHKVNGLLFEPGDIGDLEDKIKMLSENLIDIKNLSNNARITYIEKYNSELNYSKLIDIYEMAINN